MHLKWVVLLLVLALIGCRTPTESVPQCESKTPSPTEEESISLAMNLYKGGRFIDSLERVRDLKSGSAMGVRIACLEKLGREKEAEALFRECTKAHHWCGTCSAYPMYYAKLYIAEAFRQLGEYPRALKIIEQADRALILRSEDGRMARAAIYEALGREEKAMRMYEEVVTLFPRPYESKDAAAKLKARGRTVRPYLHVLEEFFACGRWYDTQCVIYAYRKGPECLHRDLEAFLTHENERVRFLSAALLGLASKHSAIPVLGQALVERIGTNEGDRHQYQALAGRILCEFLPDDQALAFLRRSADHLEPGARCQLIENLASSGVALPDLRELLRNRLNDEIGYIRQSAAFWLFRYGDAAGIPLVIGELGDIEDKWAKNRIVEKLELVLMVAFHDPERDEDFSDPETADRIRSRLDAWWSENREKDPEQVTREGFENAGFPPGDFHTKQGLDALVKALAAKDYRIAYNAMCWLTRLTRAYPPELGRLEKRREEWIEWLSKNRDKLKWKEGPSRFVIQAG